MMAQSSSAASGLSVAAAPAAKSATTASMGIPPPAIRMPVCPVARKCVAIPRARKARVNARAVYFFPMAQSVPTVSNLLPLRLRPFAIGMFCGGRRTSMSLRPLCAAAASSGAMSASLVCMPLMMSSPASSALSNAGIQASAINPPSFATPITKARAPFAVASTGVRNGRPVVTVVPAQAYSPTQRSRAQSRRPKAVLAYSASVMSPRNKRYGCGKARFADAEGVMWRSRKRTAVMSELAIKLNTHGARLNGRADGIDNIPGQEVEVRENERVRPLVGHVFGKDTNGITTIGHIRVQVERAVTRRPDSRWAALNFRPLTAHPSETGADVTIPRGRLTTLTFYLNDLAVFGGYVLISIGAVAGDLLRRFGCRAPEGQRKVVIHRCRRREHRNVW